MPKVIVIKDEIASINYKTEGFDNILNFFTPNLMLLPILFFNAGPYIPFIFFAVLDDSTSLQLCSNSVKVQHHGLASNRIVIEGFSLRHTVFFFNNMKKKNFSNNLKYNEFRP